MFALQPPGHRHDLAVGGSGPAAALTLVIVAVLVLCAFTFLAPFLDETQRWPRLVAAIAAVGVIAGNLVLGAPVPAAVLALAVVFPVLLNAGLNRPQVVPWIVGAATVALVTLRQDGALIAAVALAWCTLGLPTRPRVRVAVCAQSAGFGVVLLFGVAQTIIATPPAPVPGYPIADSILVVPQRPGWNLVQLDADAVGLDRASLTSTSPRPGTSGAWAALELPAGRNTLWIRRGDRVTSVPVDTGASATASPEFTGPDGVECAQAAAGAALVGRLITNFPCPATALSPSDGPGLRRVVEFLAARGTTRITLATDTSARSIAAERVVRTAAATAHIAVSTVEQARSSRQPMVVVAGWSTADQVLRDVAERRLDAEGTYLAPWLLTTSLLRIPAGQVLALPYSPADELPMAYLGELTARLPAATPSASGYVAWLTGQGMAPPASGYRMYAASTVDLTVFSGGRHIHPKPGWLPGGVIVPIT